MTVSNRRRVMDGAPDEDDVNELIPNPNQEHDDFNASMFHEAQVANIRNELNHNQWRFRREIRRSVLSSNRRLIESNRRITVQSLLDFDSVRLFAETENSESESDTSESSSEEEEEEEDDDDDDADLILEWIN